MIPNSRTPRLLSALLSGCVCIGISGFIATSALADTDLNETVTSPTIGNSVTDISPDQTTLPSPANSEVSLPETAPSTDTLDSDSPIPEGTEPPSADTVNEGNAASKVPEQPSQNGIGSALSNPEIQKIIRDNPQILEMLKNNPQFLELLLKNSTPVPK